MPHHTLGSSPIEPVFVKKKEKKEEEKKMLKDGRRDGIVLIASAEYQLQR